MNWVVGSRPLLGLMERGEWVLYIPRFDYYRLDLSPLFFLKQEKKNDVCTNDDRLFLLFFLVRLCE